MRVGQNPIKAVESIAPPAPLTVVVISYIPFLGGYYEHGLELLKLCLASIHANTAAEFDLMVFDNASAPEVREYLLAEREAGHIQYLTLSDRNVGKPAAWNFCFAAAPGDLIAYADSDVIFYKGWLEATQAALSLPNVGMVTAMPILTPPKFSTATIEWARTQQGTESGALIAWEDFWRHARSLGDTEENARKFYGENEAVRFIHDGSHYYAGAAHFQFAAPKSVLQAVLPIPADKPMGRVRLLDEAINAKGYLRLSTETWHVQHMGNQLPTLGDLLADPAGLASSAPRTARRGIWRAAPLRKLLQWLNSWSFDKLHRG